jgi:hypothetical protein
LGGTVCAKLYVNWKVNSETSWRRWRKSRVAGAGGALYLTVSAVKNSPNQFYAIPGHFANGETGARDWALKSKTPNPRQCSKVSDREDLGVTKFFLGGVLWGGDFRTFKVFLKLFQKIICRLRGPGGLCVLDKKL